MNYYDLRPSKIISNTPLELGCLLGLGLKFCVQKETPTKLVLDDTFQRLNRDVRLKWIFSGSMMKKYDKKIYVKSTWDPKVANEETKEILSKFEDEIRKEREISHAQPCATNLSKHQFNILNHL